jgi:hypothetical protein
MIVDIMEPIFERILVPKQAFFDAKQGIKI